MRLIRTAPFIFLFLGQCGLFAQDEPSTLLKYERTKGVKIVRDSVFSMTFRFRMQNRAWFFSESGDDLTPAIADMRIRRMRLRFDGHVISPKLLYKIQLGFSRADLDLFEGTVAQPIRDAIVYYRPSDRWMFGFGQTKIAGNRQRVISSGALQLPDRSTANALFTLDRDFGFFGQWHGHRGDQHLFFKGSVTSGEGRNAGPGNEGLCYTARTEWLPLGEFTDDGDYFEGDLERERTPKVSLGLVVSTNIDATRAGGQLGPTFAGGEMRTLNMFIADALLKYNGLAVSTEFLQRSVVGDPRTSDGEGLMVNSYEGWGWNTQVSHMLGARTEVVGRYSIVMPSDRMKDELRRGEEIWLGSTYYLNHHRIKFQGAAAYLFQGGVADLDHPGNRWGMMLQVEFGI